MLAIGVLLHLSIELTLAVGFFSMTIVTLYLAFLPPERAERVLRWVRDRVAHSVDVARTPSRGRHRNRNRRPSRSRCPTPGGPSTSRTREVSAMPEEPAVPAEGAA